MKIITLQLEIEADTIGWLVSEELSKTIKIREIQLPAELNVEGGWTEVRMKVFEGPEITPSALLRLENKTDEILGAEKIYLEYAPLVLAVDYRINRLKYNIVFEVKNGTTMRRVYHAQIIYED